MHGMASERVFRKSIHGRTNLFLSNPSTLIREVKCLGGVKRYDSANVYHILPDVLKEGSSVCWHCCEPISDAETIIPIPRLFDPSEKTFHVFGATCSPGCAKAYILESVTFDKAHQLNIMTKMLRQVYHISDPVLETPPRAALKRFGGLLEPSGTKAHCRLVQPPFVSYTMLAEEHLGTESRKFVPSLPTKEEADTLNEPQAPALFSGFLKRRSEAGETGPSSQTATKRKVDNNSQGPMSRFVASK